MAFENLNYRSEWIDEESIQDKIDDGRLEITELTKEKLTSLKVDIFNEWSYLKVRTKDGTILKNKLHDDEKIDFTGEHTMDNGKVFLWVKLKDWSTWFVSADYIKWTKKKETVKDLFKEVEVIKPTPSWEKDKNEIVKDEPIETIEPIETNDNINSLSDYFDINKSKLSTLQLQLKENKLDLDLVSFLSIYKQYIESNLEWLDNKILEKIKKSIWLRILELSKIVQERIDWVDEEIDEWDYSLSERQKEIQNQRWVINGELNDLFSEIDNEVLPSAVVLIKRLDTKQLDDDLEINDMFNAELTDDWEFDKTWESGEIIDANTNSWSVIDAADEEHTKYLKENWIKTIEWKTLLSNEDVEIQDKAMLYWYWVLAWLIANDIATFSWVWTIPWAVIWVWYDWVDMLSDEDTWMVLLKQLNLIDENFRMEKSLLDNLLATIWIIPWLTAVIKSAKLAKYMDKLNPKQLKEFNKAKDKVSNLIKNWFKKTNKIDEIKDATKSDGLYAKFTWNIDELPKNQIVEVKWKDWLKYSLKTNSEGKIDRIEYLDTWKKIEVTDTKKWFDEKIEIKNKWVDETAAKKAKNEPEIKKTSKGDTLKETKLNTLSSYENKRFSNIILSKLKNKKNLILENNKWEKLEIRLNDIWKYIINNKESKPFTKKQLLTQIDESYKIRFLDNENINNILNIWKGEEIKLLKSLWSPINWRLRIKEWWKVFLDWKELNIRRAKQLLKMPEIRKAILKQKLDNIKIEEVMRTVSKLKGFDKVKWLGNWAWQLWTERFFSLLKSWLIWWTSTVLLEVFLNAFTAWERWEEPDERFLQLVKIFAIWAVWWLVLSWLKTGVILVWKTAKVWLKTSWSVIKASSSFAWKHKWYIAGIWTISYVAID